MPRKTVLREPGLWVHQAPSSQARGARGVPTALLHPLLSALVPLACRPGGSLGCVLPRGHVRVSRDNLALLGQMRTLSPFLCLRDRKDFRFPRDTLEGGGRQGAQAAAVPGSCQRVLTLPHTERSSAAWSPALLDRLRAGLHPQLEGLDACAGRAPGTDGPALAIRRYFQDICLYLQDQGYSDCAWEVVRLEIKRALSSTVTLPDRLGIKD